MYHIKVVAVGDGNCQKVQLLYAITNPSYIIDDYTPTVFDNYEFHYSPNVTVQLWDTAGQEDYKKLRPLSYPSTNALLLCFSLVQPVSLENIKYQWIKELNEFCPGVPIILVGLQLEIREQFDEKAQELHSKGYEPVSTVEGKEMAREIKACCYIECSLNDKTTVKSIMDAAVKYGLEHQKGTYQPNNGIDSQDNGEGSCCNVF